jgi:hypothetical protein
MAKANRNILTNTSKKKTKQGDGTYSKNTNSGGETFHGNVRAGTKPNRAHRRSKPYRGQGK